jgi:hypothetical protein
VRGSGRNTTVAVSGLNRGGYRSARLPCRRCVQRGPREAAGARRQPCGARRRVWRPYSCILARWEVRHRAAGPVGARRRRRAAARCCRSALVPHKLPNPPLCTTAPFSLVPSAAAAAAAAPQPAAPSAPHPAAGVAPRPAAAPAGRCATMADVLSRELGMQLSPVFQRLYGNPSLKARAGRGWGSARGRLSWAVPRGRHRAPLRRGPPASRPPRRRAASARSPAGTADDSHQGGLEPAAAARGDAEHQPARCGRARGAGVGCRANARRSGA